MRKPLGYSSTFVSEDVLSLEAGFLDKDAHFGMAGFYIYWKIQGAKLLTGDRANRGHHRPIEGLTKGVELMGSIE